MLIDEANIHIVAGSGGPGRASFYARRGKPSGGDGGAGGSVYAQVNPQLSSLLPYSERKEFIAPAGEPGGGFTRAGHDGDDITLSFPLGTQLTDQETGEVFELTLGTPLLLARGGSGGWGNATINRMKNHLFSEANPGRPGQRRRLKVVMKLIADCGLIGFPNAGKSSLLNVLTQAQAKVADYPFTTLEPNLGVFYGQNGYLRVVLADVPGLIEGASQGKGLGHKFLKHIEKVRVLLHCISCESQDPVGDYEKIRAELAKFNPVLLEKKEIILLTKIDLLHDNPKELSRLTKLLGDTGREIIASSIIDDESLVQVKQCLQDAITSTT